VLLILVNENLTHATSYTINITDASSNHTIGSNVSLLFLTNLRSLIFCFP
jgi:hypothetical protein